MANYHFYHVAFSYFLLVPGLVLAQNCNSNHGVVFLFPTTGDAFNYGGVVNVSWTSSFTNPLLYTFCSNSTSSDIQEQLTNVASFNASLLVQLKWPNVDTCFFDLRPNTSACYGANSPTFNVIQETRAPTTYGLAVPTAAPSSSPSTTADSTITTSALTTSTGLSTTSTGNVPATVTVTAGNSISATSGAAFSKSSSGLSSGAKTGIGVGVALGAVIIIAGAAAFFFLRRRNTTKGAYELPGAQEQKGSWYGGSNPQSSPGQYMYMQPLRSGGIPAEQKNDAVPPVSHELLAEPERMVHEMSPESAVRNPGRNRFSWQQTPR